MNEDEKEALEITVLTVALIVVLSALDVVAWMNSALSCRDPAIDSNQCVQMLIGVAIGSLQP
jgi:hypothetical protein